MRKIQKTFVESGLIIMLLTSLFVLLSYSAAAQQPQTPASPAAQDIVSKNTSAQPNAPATTAAVAPVYKDFMGVTLGMSAGEIRAKLGHVKDKGERQDFFVFSESQSAQIVYDDQGKAIIISVDYLKDSGAPTPESVLGEAPQVKTDGSIYQRKRYPEAGYWVAYSKTAGDNPIVTVTMQKI